MTLTLQDLFIAGVAGFIGGMFYAIVVDHIRRR